MQAARSFSALQRAEIAEIENHTLTPELVRGFSALQRAEIAEIQYRNAGHRSEERRFSALQRAEIAEISLFSLTGLP